MEIRHLNLIKTIVEEETLINASEKLNLTQSALSHQLRQIEFELEIKLFKRTNRKMMLTEAGQKVYELSVEVFEKWKQTEAEIKAISTGNKGEISILTDCHTSYHWLPSLMKEYNTIYKDIILKMGTPISNDILKNLQNGVDIVITPYVEKNNKRLYYFPLFKDESLLVLSRENPLSKKKFIEPRDLSTENLIIYSNPIEETLTYKLILEPNEITPNKVTVVPFTEASIEMIKSNLGVGVYAQWSVKNYLSDPKLLFMKIGKDGLIRQHYGAILKENIQKKLLSNFLEHLNAKGNI